MIVATIALAGMVVRAQNDGFAAIPDKAEDTASIAQNEPNGSSNNLPPPVERPNPLEDARDRIYYPGDTERAKPLLWKLGGNILLDQKQIWTSPFHMHASDAKWWIGFGAITAALIATDHSTSTLLENSKGQ